jgi:hypothetical protein
MLTRLLRDFREAPTFAKNACFGSGHAGLGYVLEGTMVSAFDDDVEEIIIAGQGFQDKASFHRMSRNCSATESMRFVIAYTVKMGEPNTTWPSK